MNSSEIVKVTAPGNGGDKLGPFPPSPKGGHYREDISRVGSKSISGKHTIVLYYNKLCILELIFIGVLDS